MNKTDKTFVDGDRDPRVTALLREIYAPPSSPAYWELLEHRIMTGLDESLSDAGDWWTVLSGWGRTGLVAAGIAMLVAGAAMTQVRRADAAAAYAMIDEPVSVQTPLVEPSAGIARDATLRYVTSY